MRLVSVVTSTRSPARPRADLAQQVVDLADGPHLDHRVEQAGGRMICSTTTPWPRASS
jgi:hypothetical protein